MVATRLLAPLALLLLALPARADTPHPALQHKADVERWIADELPKLTEDYKQLHRQPELSLRELRTAKRLADELTSLGFEVTTSVGGPNCPGIVGLLKNGKGPTVMVRTDLDALPVTEKTGLDYASQEQVRDKDGKLVGVMHACGHDIHMTCWLGVARYLASHRDNWVGTLMLIGQPAEEIGAGARLMLADGLFRRFPKPDFALALHADARTAHGTISYTDGLAMANVDTVEILVKGKGGHGAAPHVTIDPIVLAARIVLDLQTIVSREVDPLEPAVVTVGSIHGGTKSNIIPNDVRLQLTVRSTKDDTRKHVLEAIERIAKAAAAASRAPAPVVTHFPEEFTPALINNAELTKRTTDLFRKTLGESKVQQRPPVMGGEDFGQYGRAGVPIFMYFLGTIDPERVALADRPDGQPLPSMHSDLYYPIPEPSLRTGVLTMTLAVLDLMSK
jgi:hippurate hydrolase